MSNSNAPGLLPDDDDLAAESRAERGDVTIEKQVRWLDEDTLRVEFGITSNRDDPIELRIEEPIPDQLPLDNVGFHGDYGWQNWYVEHDTLLAHEVELDPAEEILTLYAVKLEEENEFDPSVFGADPSFTVTSLLDGDEETSGGEPTVADESDSSAVTPEAVGDGGSEKHDRASMEPATSEESDARVETSMFDDADSTTEESPDGDSQADAQSTETDAGAADSEDATSASHAVSSPSAMSTTDVGPAGSAGTPSGGADSVNDEQAEADRSADATDSDGEAAVNGFPTEDGNLVTALLTELESGDSSEADLKELRSRLGVQADAGASTSMNVRLQRVESELNEVSAYTDALEDFLNENGTGRELLEDLSAQSDKIEDTLSSLQDTVDDLTDRVETVEARGKRFDEFAARIDDLRADFEDVSDRAAGNDDVIESLSERLETVENRYITDTESLEEDVEEMEHEIEEIGEWQQRFVRILNDFTAFAEADAVTTDADDTSSRFDEDRSE